MNRTLRRLVLPVLIAVAGGAMAWYLLREKPVSVVARPVGRGRVEATVANTRTGTVMACRRAALAPTIGGQVVRLGAREGERVKEGGELLQLWNDDLKAELKLAQSEALAARARAEEACSLAKVAQKEAERLKKLLLEGVAPEDKVDQAVADAEAKAAGCRAAEAAAQVSSSRIEVATAALERTVLRAPFDSVVADLNTEVGELVIPSPPGIPTLPALDVIEEGCLYVRAPLDEVDAPRVREGMSVRVTLDAFPEHTFEGRVRRVASFVLDREKQARTVDIDVDLVDPDQLGVTLLPGYSVDVEVLLDSREQALRVPYDAILEGPRVLVFRDGVLEERKIETGISNWRFSEVLTGLAEGELIVTSLDREGVKAGATAILEEPVAAQASAAP